jgi:putative membrane protein
MLVGIANIIPGVSGGTFALILGIYERIIAAIGAIGAQTIKIFLGLIASPKNKDRRQAFATELERTDAVFLMILALGAIGAILASSRLITFVLDNHRAATLAFFVGLIVPSILVPYALLERKGIKELLSAILACGLLVVLTAVMKPEDGASQSSWLTIFIAGAISISAMILPGVSGSFMLMLLGEYRAILVALNTGDIPTIAVFAAGCLVGLLAFVRFINFMLKRYHSVTVAFLIGLIVGSLWVLWPFKEVPPGSKIMAGINIWPPSFDSQVIWALGFLVLGLLCSAGLNVLGKTQNNQQAMD